MDTGIIILAAGSSSRLGHPKQLLAYRGTTLLQHITEESLRVAPGLVIVVLGAYSDEILRQQADSRIIYTINKSWEDGMSSSICSGLSEILKRNKDLENVIITVADQPYTGEALFLELTRQHIQTGKGIVASGYGQTIGTPVFFNKKYFNQLLGLKGHEGAKKLLKLYRSDLETVPFKQGVIDIDTERDYKHLLNRQMK